MGVAVVAATYVACSPQVEVPPTATLSSFASASAPLSWDDGIALVTEGEACVIDSFDPRVLCMALDGSVSAFGRTGEGPGEFTRPIWLARVSAGRVGVYDSKLNRLTAFRPDGTMMSIQTMPSLFFPTSVRGSKLFGEGLLGRVPGAPVEEGAVPTRDLVLVELDSGSGDVVWHRRGLEEIAATECGRLSSGIPTPGGGYVLTACRRELVFLEDRDGVEATVVKAPTYVEELPNERDVEDHLEGLARMFGGSGGSADMDGPQAAAYRDKPKGWFIAGGKGFDGLGRLWVATRRDRDAFSYLDIWVGMDYAGTVRIRDRLVGFDILNTTLAVLVERRPGPDGISQRAIDWYDIGDIELGL